jgi:hypothetical protein
MEVHWHRSSNCSWNNRISDLTAGAIFALIPPALEIFAAIMMAQAVAKASGFFKTFMTDGWLGKQLLQEKH